MATFQIFRVKVEYPAQRQMFTGVRLAPAALILEAVQSKPASDPEKPTVWHIGNLEPLTPGAIVFRIGRTTPAIEERFDQDKGDFIDEQVDLAPYTHVLLDLELQVCAIAIRPRLAKRVTTIARRLEELLSRSGPVQNYLADVVVAEIPDPEGFIELLRRAESILKFTATISPPNPFDEDEDFQKPLGKCLVAAQGKTAKLELQGEQLDEETLEKMARAVAATGNKASARLRLTPRSKPVIRKLVQNPVTFSAATEIGDWARGAFKALSDAYIRVRDTIKRKK